MKTEKSVSVQIHKDNPEFADACNSLSVEQLNARLAAIAKDAEAIEDAKESDAGLEEAKALVSELSAPYRDGKKAVRLKMRYLIYLLKEKGAGNAA